MFDALFNARLVVELLSPHIIVYAEGVRFSRSAARLCPCDLLLTYGELKHQITSLAGLKNGSKTGFV